MGCARRGQEEGKGRVGKGREGKGRDDEERRERKRERKGNAIEMRRKLMEWKVRG